MNGCICSLCGLYDFFNGEWRGRLYRRLVIRKLPLKKKINPDIQFPFIFDLEVTL